MTDLSKSFVGVGVYAKGKEPGTLDAQWARSDWLSSEPEKGIVCGGRATGGPKDGFAGDYSITYTDEHGKPGVPYKLAIKSAGEAYQLTWETDDQTRYVGVAIELDGKLVLAWMPKTQ